jgi:hypothetical protein
LLIFTGSQRTTKDEIEQLHERGWGGVRGER